MRKRNLFGFCQPANLQFLLSGFLIVLILYLLPVAGCQGLTIIDTGVGTIRLSIDEESMSKGVIRTMPDTNSFILKIYGGDTIYNGLYGARPKELKVEQGTYTVEVFSSINTGPKFDSPVWSDSKSVTVAAGSVSSISLLCRQTNGGMRLGFSAEFKTKFSAYTAEVYDIKGSSPYLFTEERFLYLTPGQILVRMVPQNSELSQIPLFSKVLAAKEMLTINVRLEGADSASIGSGILIDSSSFWITDSLLVGSNDGSTKEKAISVNRLSEYVGLKVWVSGYIVGGDLTQSAVKFDLPFTSKSNMAIAAAPATNDRSLCYSVSLPSGPIQTAFNLVDNPANFGKKVWVKGTVSAKYLGLIGIDTTTEVIIE
ncbi:MAG: hypothetical protein ACD_77C00391G0008 [uncultured bacterium]|nr:MAG: hypothetical protein ACD_77C00391G0008 [uncultured bacterium]